MNILEEKGKIEVEERGEKKIISMSKMKEMRELSV
jgi:hypothetical protein